MNAGWKTVKLGEVCSFERGLTYSKSDEADAPGITVLRANNVDLTSGQLNLDDLRYISAKVAVHEKKYLSANSIIVCTASGSRDHLGKTAHISEPPRMTFGGFMGLLIPSPEIDSRFLFYLTRSDLYRSLISGLSSGTNINNLKGSDLLSWEIPLPPLAEQKRIVALLDEAFAGIEEAKVKAEANLGNAIGLFEMVREDSMREPEAQTTSYGFDYICKVDSVLVDPRESTNAAKLHVGGANIESKTGRLIALQTARQEGLKSGKFPFQEGMVLYSKIRPNLMKVARPDFDGLCSADMYPLAPVDGRVCRDYLYHLLLTERFTRFALLGSERAGMPKVNRDYLSRFTTKLPSINEQQALASKLDSLDQSLRLLRELLTNKLAALQELKSSLLSQAFAGELTA